ncbi:MAG: tetratricopeptide repeat protein [Thermoplasmata archaeon]|nr:tetratricopeptide repeat protein [Thermoplasmata archaeon]
MAVPNFGEFVGRLVDAFGEQMEAVRPVGDSLWVKSRDGFLFAFVEDPNRVSLEEVGRMFQEVGSSPAHLVVLSPARLPLAIGADVVQKGGTLVEGQRFLELARGLGLEIYLGEEPRAAVPRDRGRLLPSAQQLDLVMERASDWMNWGVPALALRFYRQALQLKPEFTPAQAGMGRSLLALGLREDADRTFDEILAAHPGDVDARLGKASVLGARGDVAGEVRVYRSLLSERDDQPTVRAHLLAALLTEKQWSAARDEVRTMLRSAPDDPSLRFLLGVATALGGNESVGEREKQAARALGLTWEREKALLDHLGLPAPPPPVPGSEPPPRPRRPGRRSERRSSTRRKAAPKPKQPAKRARKRK